MRDVRPHYIRKNESARIPERFIILDTEAYRERNKKGEVQSWALGTLTFLEFRKSGSMMSTSLRSDTPLELWQAISEFTRPKRRTVLYAHNLNYDLRISQALSSLTQLGWTLQDMRLDGRGSWSRWSRQNASLLLCDSASIFPVKLQQLATELGMVKPPLPPADQREALYRRCEADTAILSKAITLYVQWLRTSECGNWQMTGASQSWSHFRHSKMQHPILVHNNDEALAAERAAMHAGRAEAWQWGKVKGEKLWEYDWSNSYPRIARDNDLPQTLFGTLNAPDFRKVLELRSKYCILADCTITTKRACVPTTYNDRTLWPVGVFRTTLWDPELALLQAPETEVIVHKAWLYKKAPILREWAEWILSSLYDQTGTVEQWKKLILKHWSRSLIGRFGMRYRAWELFATTSESNITTSLYHDSDTGITSELMQIGTSIFKLGEYREVNDGCPQITGYIMSEARAKLWRTTMQMPDNSVYYMDTDSLVVSHAGHIEIQRRAELADFQGLRTKATYNSAHIYGPRSAIFGNRPSVSGMPKDSKKTEPNKYLGDIWRGCQESIARGEHDRVAIVSRTFTLRYNTNRRAFCDNGRTVPYELPQYVPSAGYVPPKSRIRRAILNGYPAMLTHSTPVKHGPRPIRQ